MKSTLAKFATACAITGFAGTAVAGTVSVSFPDSEHYSDMNSEQWPPHETMAVLAAHLQYLAQRRLPADAAMKVEILDIKLAGEDEWWHRRPWKVRVLRSVTWPSIKLRYSLEQSGMALRSGEETIADLSYLDHINPYFRDDPLRYEKRMLDDWFRRRFVAMSSAP